ncbi:hypothetical protein OKA04_19005 [Luteolibacter flavescens]|uniref:Uncharacterized protein n=1 Tax=Luteolibacter flavescens TaxID=1859460 RepID=A0ABT3FTS6_9BACT|nr:hypothetical protein [Luteolibacter flavescens]MCW1886837.1 hypothetical protein [Luteolibacter flavescens]
MTCPTFLLLLAALFAIPVASAINPSIPLDQFDEARGFTSVQAFNDPKSGFTEYRIILNPAKFLSHFSNAFPGRVTAVDITLRGERSQEFKGLTVELGSSVSEVEEFPIIFSIPTSDLGRYELEFQCSIPFAVDEPPIVGGAMFHASLAKFRRAPSTIREDHPVWKEMEAKRLKSPSSLDQSGADFGGPTKRIEPPPPATNPSSR